MTDDSPKARKVSARKWAAVTMAGLAAVQPVASVSLEALDFVRV